MFCLSCFGIRQREAKDFPPEQQTVVQRQQHQQNNAPSSPRHMSPRSLADIPETKTPEEETGEHGDAQSKILPEGRRRSSAGIQRQASVCVSDGEEEESTSQPAADGPHISNSASSRQTTPQTKQRQNHYNQRRHRHRASDEEGGTSQALNITQVSAVVHRSGTEVSQHQRSCPSLLACDTVGPNHSAQERSRVCSTSGRDSHDLLSEVTVSSASSKRIKGQEARSGLQSSLQRRSYHLQSTSDLEEHSHARRLNRHSTGSLPLLRERSVTSLEGEGWTEIPTPLREAGSTEVGLLEKGLEAHLRKRLGLRAPDEEEDDDTDTVKRPVRYNDTGSKEDIREDISSSPEEEMDEEAAEEEEEELDEEEDDDTEEYERVQLEYKLLWQLRTTLEEEEELSDTLRLEDEEEEGEMEDPEEEGDEKEGQLDVTLEKEEDSPKELDESSKSVTTKDTSPDKEASSSHTASFESSTAPTEDPASAITEQVFSHLLSLPTADSRRSSYVSRASKRLKRSVPGSTEGQNSFDSSASAEWSSTDASRASTSFESSTTTTTTTTDNTDSTAESQTRKLQQMKADSGYKSMESTEHPPPGHMTIRLRGQCALEGDSIEEADEALFSSKEEEALDLPIVQSAVTQESKEADNKQKSPVVITIIDETLENKTKRSFPRQVRSAVSTELESITSTESSTVANIPQEVLGKMSVFQRFFRSSRPPRIERLIRDYSIDEKTDSLFREFSRQDPGLEADAQRAWSAAWRQSHFRLHHQAHHPHHHLHRRIDQDDDVPLASAKVMSPQVSIEEESDIESRLAPAKIHKGDARMQESDWGRTTGLILQDIPAIRLPEEDLL